MNTQFKSIYQRLYDTSREEGFIGHDPFDGLNSRIFQATPLKNSVFARLAWLQIIKRSPLNLRPFLKVNKGINSKGIALFALAELSRFRTDGKSENGENARQLLKILADQKLTVEKDGTGSGTILAWGYNFDWQSRAFFAPQGTPTIVPTAFAGSAFVEGYECLNDPRYLEIAESVCRFITVCLNRPVETDSELCFSYTESDDHVIYNASLLAGEMLARVGTITNDIHYLDMAEKAARFVVNNQKEDGSWAYGPKLRHSWVDNFHTAFIIGSLARIQKIIPAVSEFAAEPVARALDYWLENFFLDDGAPKYFDKQTYPIDIHSAAAAIVTCCDLAQDDPRCPEQAETVARWTCGNMLDETGHFYYQVNRLYKNKTSFIRWNDAWMAFALARLMERDSVG